MQPDAACPLYMTPLPIAEASVETTTCLDTCTRGTPARRKARSDQGLKDCRAAMLISGFGREANAEVVSYEATRAA